MLPTCWTSPWRISKGCCACRSTCCHSTSRSTASRGRHARSAGATRAAGLADDAARAPELMLHVAEIESAVGGWLAELNARQRTVIERRYGLNGHDVATLDVLAREMGVTRERVRKIQGEALDKLRAKLARRGYTRDALL